MYHIFDLKTEVGSVLRLSPDWLNVEKGLKLNLDTVIKYYHENPTAVNSSHLLVRILTSIGVPLGMDILRYYDNVDIRSHDVARVMGITSSTNRGKVFNGVFYNNDCNELILHLDDEFDPNVVERDWREISPVVCLRHPTTDLMLNLPEGVKKGSDYGIAVTGIHIAKMCVMYRGFRKHESYLAKTIPDYVEKSSMQFVRMYVLPNMLKSSLDEVIFNRVYNLTVGAPIGESYHRQPFHMVDWNTRLNKVHLYLIDTLTKNKADFTMLLRNIPMVSKTNLEDTAKLPDVAQTRQVMWLLITAKLRVLIWLLKMTELNGSTKNIHDVNKLRRYFLRIKRNNQIITQLPLAFKEDLMDELEEVFTLLKI